MLTCDIMAVSPNLKSVCAPTSTESSVDEATRVEHLIMGMFVSAALFELSERLPVVTLPSFNFANEICAAVVIVTVYHSLTSRATGLRTVNGLVLNLWKGSLLYALSLFGMSFGSLLPFRCLA